MAIRKNHKGFTLIELLIVVTVIGLLSSIVLVGLGGVRSRGRDTRRIADLRQVQNVLELYFDRQRTYPQVSSWANLQTELRTQNILTANQNLPLDPVNSGSYIYNYAFGTGGLNYVMAAQLENSDNPALRDDVDGSVFGVTCGTGTPPNETPPVYCVQI